MRGTDYVGAPPPSAPSRGQTGERRVALVIGNANYASERDALANPHNDAKGIAAALARIGFTGVKAAGPDDFTVDYAASGVEPHLDLNNQRLGRALAAMARACAGTSQAVIYYAGHGIELNGENYLIPTDAKLAHIADAEFETQALTRALRAIEGATGLRLVILDACRNNPFRGRLFGARDMGSGLRSIEPPGSVLVAYAAKHGTTAWDGEKGSNSPFAASLLRHIETPGLEVVDLFREVKDDVLEATNLGQEPFLYGSVGRRREYFVRESADHRPPTPGPVSDLLSWSRAEWDRLEASTDIEKLRRFAERADPYYAHEARDRISALEVQARQAAEAERARAEAEAKRHAEEAAQRAEQQELARRYAADWDTAKREGTIAAYERFLAAWTGGAHESEAKRTLAALNAEELLRPRAFYPIRVGTGTDDKVVQLAPRQSIKDADYAPELVLVPPGKFWMGSEIDNVATKRQRPRHEVSILYPFLVGKYPITFREWDAFVAMAPPGVKPTRLDDGGWGRDCRPAINVSWIEAKSYVAWLSQKTGKTYRLLSEAEWEYCCRAGTTSKYSFGNEISASQAQFSTETFGSARSTSVVGKFQPNQFGLHDMHGNVMEWCEDVSTDDYSGHPGDGSPVTKGPFPYIRVRRGGCWYLTAGYLASCLRDGARDDSRDKSTGFRVMRTLAAG